MFVVWTDTCCHTCSLNMKVTCKVLDVCPLMSSIVVKRLDREKSPNPSYPNDKVPTLLGAIEYLI